MKTLSSTVGQWAIPINWPPRSTPNRVSWLSFANPVFVWWSPFHPCTCHFYLDVLHCHCPNSRCLWTGVVSHVWHFYELTCQLLVAGWDGHAVSACLRPVALWSPEVENILHQNGNCDEISFENKRVPNVLVRLCKCMPSNLLFVKSECRRKKGFWDM